jgi:signal transduction histidine kinase/CheY-like chemotaxis protein
MLALRYWANTGEGVRRMEDDTGGENRWFPADQVPAFAEAFGARKTIFEAVPSWRPDRSGELIRAIVAPLCVGEESFGLLAVNAESLSREETHAITAFANQAAAAWRKTTLMQDLEGSLTELKKTQEQLLHAQKMEAIGRLAGGIAHDFNNLLTVISGYTNLLVESLGAGHHAQADLTEIKAAIKRASALTSRLLAFGRKQILQPVMLDLNRTAVNSVKLLRPLIREDIEIAMNLSPTPVSVCADPYQLEQVIMNLTLNARDAMPNGGTLGIRTGRIDIPERGTSAEPPSELPPGAYAELAVRDTGVGMSETVKGHLFEPFFTTKEDGKGTGLGLSTVYGIVAQTGGRIRVESAPGQGSTFTITIPWSSTGEAPAAEEIAASLSPPGSGVVLVAEDEATVRDLARRVLLRGGYSVLAASSAHEALRIAESAPRIDLLLTDLVMPGGMNGVELGERLTLRRPGLKVLYMSGYLDAVAARFGLPEARLQFIAKPFQMGELLKRVSELLGGPLSSAAPPLLPPDTPA